MSTTGNRWLLILLLSIFLGFLGVQRFVVGKVGTGILYLLTYGLFGVGWLVDIITIATGNFRDKSGIVIKRTQKTRATPVHGSGDARVPSVPEYSAAEAIQHKPSTKTMPVQSFTPRHVSRFDSWVAVDVEWTDSANKSSVCEIGLARFDDGKLTDTWRSYVRPPGRFSIGFMELRTHGIELDLLNDAPTLAILWPTIEEFIEKRGWVLHNATNDVNRILHSLRAGGRETLKDFDYVDSMGIARKFSWINTSSSLDALAEHFEIDRTFARYEGREAYGSPHGAVEDAQLTGLVLQRMVELAGYTNLKAFLKLLEIEPGRVRDGALLNGFSARGAFKYETPADIPPETGVLASALKADQQANQAVDRRRAAEESKAQFLRNPDWSTRTLTRGDIVCFTQLMPWGENNQNHEAEVHRVAERLGIEIRHSLKSDLDLLVVNDPWIHESAKLRDALSRKMPIPVTTYSIFQKNNPEFPRWNYLRTAEYKVLINAGLWPGA